MIIQAGIEEYSIKPGNFIKPPEFETEKNTARIQESLLIVLK